MSEEIKPTLDAGEETLKEFSAMVDPEPLLSLLQNWNSELISFYGKRLQHYWALPVQLMTCSTADDIARVHQEFHARTIEEYRQEADKLATLMKTCGNEAAALTPSYEEALLKAQADAQKLVEQARVHAERIITAAEHRAAEIEARADEAKPASKTKAA